MQIQVPSIACDVRMSMTKSSRPEQKAKTHEKLTWKILEENLVPLHTHYFFHLILRSPKFSQNAFPTKRKPGKCPEKKKNGARKAKEEGGRRVKGKSQDCCVTFKPNKLSRNFAPAHAQTLEADIYIWNKRPQSASLQMALGKF